MILTDRQKLVLKVEGRAFHFASFDSSLYNEAKQLQEEELITITENHYEQYSVFQCWVTDKGVTVGAIT